MLADAFVCLFRESITSSIAILAGKLQHLVGHKLLAALLALGFFFYPVKLVIVHQLARTILPAEALSDSIQTDAAPDHPIANCRSNYTDAYRDGPGHAEQSGQRANSRTLDQTVANSDSRRFQAIFGRFFHTNPAANLGQNTITQLVAFAP